MGTQKQEKIEHKNREPYSKNNEVVGGQVTREKGGRTWNRGTGNRRTRNRRTGNRRIGNRRTGSRGTGSRSTGNRRG